MPPAVLLRGFAFDGRFRLSLSGTMCTEDSPSGLWRTLGKRVGCKPSGVRIPHPPQVFSPGTAYRCGSGAFLRQHPVSTSGALWAAARDSLEPRGFLLWARLDGARGAPSRREPFPLPCWWSRVVRGWSAHDAWGPCPVGRRRFPARPAPARRREGPRPVGRRCPPGWSAHSGERVHWSPVLRVTVSSEPPQGRNAARIRVRCRVRGGSSYSRTGTPLRCPCPSECFPSPRLVARPSVARAPREGPPVAQFPAFVLPSATGQGPSP